MSEIKTAIRFEVNGQQAEQAMGAVARSASLASTAVVGLRDKVLGTTRGFAAWGASQVGVQLGLFAIGRAAFQSAKELGSMTKALGATINTSTNWNSAVSGVDRVTKAMAESKKVAEALEEAESNLAMPMEELAAGFNQVGGTLMGRYGQSVAQATKSTIAAATMAKAMGISVSEVASGMTRVLETRNVRGMDSFSIQMRALLGNAKDLKKMAPEKLLERLTNRMESMGPAAAAMADGLDGTLFRFKDTIDDTLRNSAIPAVTYIAKVFEGWRTRLEAAAGGGKKFSEIVGDKILGAVKKIHEFTKFVADNWKIIATVVGGMVLSKVVSQTASIAASLGEAFSAAKGLLGALGGSGGAAAAASGAGGLASKLGALALTAGLVVAALQLFHLGLTKLADWIDKKQSAGLQNQSNLGTQGFAAALNLGMATGDKSRSKTQSMLQNLSSLGLLDAQGNLQQGKLVAQMRTDSDFDTRREWAKALGVVSSMNLQQSPGMQADLVTETFNKRFNEQRRAHPELWSALGQTPVSEATGIATGDKVNPKKTSITQNFHGPLKIEQKFEEADPDNVFIQFREGLENLGSKRLQSVLVGGDGG